MSSSAQVAGVSTLHPAVGITSPPVPGFQNWGDPNTRLRSARSHLTFGIGIAFGSLWYLTFRDVELLSDDAARVRAGKLGLQGPADSAEAKAFWLAVQEFLSKR